MSQYFQRTPLGDGIHFSSVRDPKFKHNSVTVNLILPLDEEKAASRAILPFLLRKGSKHCPDFTQLEQALCKLYGASLDAGVSQYGESQILGCSISCVDDRFALNGEAITSQCARLLGDIVLCPNLVDGAFPQEDFQLERQFLIDTIEAEINEKRVYALNQCRREMCKGTRLAVNKYGTVAAARRLTAREAAQTYEEVLRTAAVEIVFVGCGDPEPVCKVFQELFSDISRCPAFHTPAPFVERAGELRRKTERMDIVQSKMVLGFRTGKLPDKHSVSAMRLMTFLYGGAPFALLFQNVREKLSLCYYCAARFDPATGMMMVDIGLEQKNREKAQVAILDQLGAISRGEFSEDEFKAAQLAYVNSLKSVGDSPAAVESWCTTRILQGTNHSPADEVQDILGVTAQEVADAAKQVTLDTVYFLTGKEEEPHE